jgi:hypothetical protein
MRGFGLCVAAMVLALTSGAASAAPIPKTGVTREQVLNWLQKKGYVATIKADTVSHDNYVSTSSQGANWGIYFYACDSEQRCTSLQYSVAWNDASLTADQINSWNRTKRFMRAYSTTDGAVFGEYDFDVAPGGSWDAMDQTLTRWEAQMPNFQKYVLDLAGGH